MPVRLIVNSDYLCPWCYNAAVRLHRLEQEFGERLHVEWRSFLLRPQPSPQRSLEKFRAYTRSWKRPAAEPDSGSFRVWQSDVGPPSHSMPPHLLAKAAATFGKPAFDRMHALLLHAYFAENRDITDDDVMHQLWEQADLPAEGFERSRDADLVQAVLHEHHEAVDAGVTGVPAVRMQGRDAIIVGAHPIELYRRWVQRALDEQEGDSQG